MVLPGWRDLLNVTHPQNKKGRHSRPFLTNFVILVAKSLGGYYAEP
jgi:hypothetical protein